MDLFRPEFDNEPYRRVGEHLGQIGFPLGGIGAGCVSLDGRGGLRDWEIYGRPNKNSIHDYTFPMLWVQAEGEEPRALTLQDKRRREWLSEGRPGFWDYGHGRFFSRMDGLPAFDGVEFRGTWPVARLTFEKKDLPVEVELAAVSSFVPQDLDASDYPLALLVYRVKNTSGKRVRTTLAWTMENPVGIDQPAAPAGQDKAWNRAVEGEGFSGILYGNDRFAADAMGHGTFCLATSWKDVEKTVIWPEEGWWDGVRAVWNRFRETGSLGEHGGKSSGRRMPGTLGCRLDLAPGESADVPFVLAWHFPNRDRYWNKPQEQKWRTHYALRWPDAEAVAKDFLSKLESLVQRTLAYEKAMYDSSLPREAVESVGATASILHSPTLTWMEDGTFWAWEGCSPNAGCCEGTCTHVWNYALTHTFLFPQVQKSFLDTNFQHGFNCGPPGKDGAMRFRIPIPVSQETGLWHAASDGQLGLILQAYREWRLTGDREWLTKTYPGLKSALKYAWVMWDRDRDGLVEGDMHNTYDINFQGPNPLTQFFYLGALRAMAKIGAELGETEYAAELTWLADNGSRLARETLWNGSYFIQPGDFQKPEAPRYQHGPGCLSDQLLGQLSASLSGLGHLADRDMVRSTLKSIFDHNFKSPLGDHENLQRVYAGPDEDGLLLCTWPEGGMPTYPFVYSDEVWTGIDYQVASHLALEGFEKESRAILKAVRDRYDGRHRNPWNEFECGSNYARALAAYGVLIAMSGFQYDAVEKRLSFRKEPFRSFWSVPGAWGTAERKGDGTIHVELLHGQLPAGTKIV